MAKETVTHEIKLDRSVKTILWALVVVLMLNAVPQGYFINEAMAEYLDGELTVNLQSSSQNPGYLDIRCSGCN